MDKRKALFCKQRFSLFMIYGLGHSNALVQIYILNGIQEFRTFCHRALEGFASRNETHPTSPFVDDRSRGRFDEIVFTGGATAVDQTDASHVAVRHLIAAQIDWMVTSKFTVHTLIQFAIRAISAVQGQ